jgi:hypothetical protein
MLTSFLKISFNKYYIIVVYVVYLMKRRSESWLQTSWFGLIVIMFDWSSSACFLFDLFPKVCV